MLSRQGTYKVVLIMLAEESGGMVIEGSAEYLHRPCGSTSKSKGIATESDC